METVEVWPGPMEGVTSPEFVRAVNALRLVPRWMTPFIRLSSGVPGKRKLANFLAPFLESGLPVTVQLMGTEAELIARCAETCLELGANGVNLNFGCPSRRVVNGGAGGGVLRSPERAEELLAKVGAALTGVRLSVKMRAGYAKFEELETLLPRLAATGAAEKFFIHFRTVRELYRDVPFRSGRFDTIVRLAGKTAVILNGDISTAEEARETLDRTHAAGVMCARSWMRDPYLLRRIEGMPVPAPPEGRELFRAELLRAGVGGGALIELSRLLYGPDDPHFLNLIGK